MVLMAQSSAVISMDTSVLLQDTKNRLVKMSKVMKQAGPETPRCRGSTREGVSLRFPGLSDA